jgi:hypothetical protein
MALFDYKDVTDENQLVDMWGQHINIGDVLLYPYRSGSSAGAIHVVEVTGIKAGTESAQTASWEKDKGYTYYTEQRTVLHVFGRRAGSRGKAEWLRYPERAVNITDSNLMTFVEAEDGDDSSASHN